MSKIRLGTFNCENLFLRYKFNGPLVRHKKGESGEDYQKRKQAARRKALVEFDQTGGPLDWLNRELEDFSSTSHTQRRATAAVIAENDPDIIALVEVESMEALRKFNTKKFFGGKTFGYQILIDGTDPRGIDVALLSKFPIVHVRSYIDDWYKTNGKEVRTFSRDCLVARVEIDGKPLTLFINHLKSQYQDDPARRTKQATRVAEIVKDTFGKDISTAYFAVVGDFNQTPDDKSLEPLLKADWNTDVLALANVEQSERWTHVFEKNKKVQGVSQLDYILLSKALASKLAGPPVIERRGLARYDGLNKYYPDSEERILPSVNGPGTEASDHCPVFVDLQIS